MREMEKRLNGIENCQYFLRKRAKKQEVMATKLDAIEKGQGVMKKKVRKMAKKLEEKGEKKEEEEARARARTDDAEMIDATQDKELEEEKTSETEAQVEEDKCEGKEVQEEDEGKEVQEGKKVQEEAEGEETKINQGKEIGEEHEDAEKLEKVAEKEPEEEECRKYTEEEKAGWILTIFRSYDEFFLFLRARGVDQMDGTHSIPPAPVADQTDGTDGTPPAPVVDPIRQPPSPVPLTPPRGRTKAMAARKLTPHKFTTPVPEKGHVHHHSGFPLLSPK
ncbi:hypothetical protein Bca101_043455 [Brassica carinata]